MTLSAVHGIQKQYLLQESYKTHKYNIWLTWKLFGVEHGGTYKKH
jgi:hypothetical protein